MSVFPDQDIPPSKPNALVFHEGGELVTFPNLISHAGSEQMWKSLSCAYHFKNQYNEWINPTSLYCGRAARNLLSLQEFNTFGIIRSLGKGGTAAVSPALRCHFNVTAPSGPNCIQLFVFLVSLIESACWVFGSCPSRQGAGSTTHMQSCSALGRDLLRGCTASAQKSQSGARWHPPRGRSGLTYRVLGNVWGYKAKRRLGIWIRIVWYRKYKELVLVRV